MLLMTTFYQFSDCARAHSMCCRLRVKCVSEAVKKDCLKPLCTELGTQILTKYNIV